MPLACIAGDGYANGIIDDISPVVMQDGKALSGLVLDETGPVIGASVIVKGTTVGTVTDMDGHFSIPGVKKGDVIQISYVGYSTQESVWDGKSQLKIILKSDSQDLDEVVVVAYGTAKKSSFTGQLVLLSLIS